MAAADTNVVLRLLLQDDDEQARAARAFVRGHAPVFVSHVVLAEMEWVMLSAYRLSRETIRRLFETLLETEGVQVQEPGVVLAAIELHRDTRAEFSDCLALAIARRAGETPLATFDRKLGRIEGARTIGPRRR